MAWIPRKIGRRAKGWEVWHQDRAVRGIIISKVKITILHDTHPRQNPWGRDLVILRISGSPIGVQDKFDFIEKVIEMNPKRHPKRRVWRCGEAFDDDI